jgi:hypothetical protein
VKKLRAPAVGLADASAEKKLDASAVRRLGASAVRRLDAPCCEKAWQSCCEKACNCSGWSVWSIFILNDEIVVINDETCIFISVCC